MTKLTSHMSREEFVNRQQKHVVQIASQMLDEKIGLIEGVRLLSSLKWDVTDDQFDPDFLLFVGIDSETDALPIGDERQHWANYALAEKDKEIRKAEDYYRAKIFDGCRKLIERFKDSL